ncbi:MAG: efflux RND transporter periplasmic adaptor subunit [Thermodesulfobacteriota bacterium]
MWMRNPGSNKRTAACLAGALALVWVVWLGQPSWGRAETKAGEKTKAAAPGPVASTAPEVSFIGKFSCPVKRLVVMPFQGVITSLEAHAGQKVKKGEVLAHYRLSPEATLQLRQRLSAPQVKDLEVRLAQLERTLNMAAVKRQEVKELAAQKMASKQALAQAEREWLLLVKQKRTIQEQLRQAKEMVTDDRQYLREQLGEPLSAGKFSADATLKAPIDGYLLFVHPNLREGAELPPKTMAFQVGVMDPMVVKAQVHEMESLKIKVGDLVEIKPESLPGQKFEARISRLSWASLKPGLENPTYYEAEFEVPNPKLILKDGMKVRIVLKKSK